MYDLQVVWLAIFVANLPGEEFEKNCESVDYLIMEKFNLELYWLIIIVCMMFGLLLIGKTMV